MATPLGNDLAVLISEIAANVSHVESLTVGLTPLQFNWAPVPGRWSIGQNLAHINSVNRQDLPALTQAIAHGRRRNLTGEGPFEHGLLSRKFIAGMEPPVKDRYRSPKMYLPEPVIDLATTIAEYRQLSGDLKRLVESAAGLHLSRVKTQLPLVPPLLRPWIKMPLGARLVLLTTHDRRHLWQAEQLRYHPEFPLA
jgi:hypothetical protein